MTAVLRPGWYLRSGTSRAPRGRLALEYGMDTTTASRTLVAVVESRAQAATLYPEAFEQRRAES